MFLVSGFCRGPPCDHLSGACVCGTAAIVDDVVGSSATEGPLPRLERTSHTRPPTGLERSVVYNEWANGCHLVFPISYPFRSAPYSLAQIIPLVLTSVVFCSWTQRSAFWSCVSVVLSGVGFRAGCSASEEQS